MSLENLRKLLKNKETYNFKDDISIYEVSQDFLTKEIIQEINEIQKKNIDYGILLDSDTIVIYNRRLSKDEINNTRQMEERSNQIFDTMDKLSSLELSKQFESINWQETFNSSYAKFSETVRRLDIKPFSKKFKDLLSQKLVVVAEKNCLIFFKIKILKATAKYIDVSELKICVNWVSSDRGRVYTSYFPQEKIVVVYSGHFLHRLKERKFPKANNQNELHYRLLTELLANKTNRIHTDSYGKMTLFVPGGACLGHVKTFDEDVCLYLITFVNEDMLTKTQIKTRKESNNNPIVCLNSWYPPLRVRSFELMKK